MELDMYFFACPKGEKPEESYDLENICYLSEYADLNGFIQSLWIAKNPKRNPDKFNDTNFRITKDVLRRIKDFVEMSAGERERYNGFFWGESDNELLNETREKCIPAIEMALNDGKKVFYHSSWKKKVRR